MPEEPTTPDPVEASRRFVECFNRRDFDAVMGFWGRDPVWDLSSVGIGTFEGLDEIRGFIEDWWGSYAEHEIEIEEVRDLGNGVTFSVIHLRGHPMGSRGELELRYGSVALWDDGRLVRVTDATDIDESRAAAERLAHERGRRV